MFFRGLSYISFLLMGKILGDRESPWPDSRQLRESGDNTSLLSLDWSCASGYMCLRIAWKRAYDQDFLNTNWYGDKLFKACRFVGAGRGYTDLAEGCEIMWLICRMGDMT